MADLTITPANVLASGGSKQIDRIAGVAVTAGQVLYDDVAAGNCKLTDSDSGVAAARSPKGIALHAAAPNQPIRLHTSGPINIGATLIPGVVYYLSPTTPGGICPVADLATGDYPVIVGIARSASSLDVKFHESGVALT